MTHLLDRSVRLAAMMLLAISIATPIGCFETLAPENEDPPAIGPPGDGTGDTAGTGDGDGGLDDVGGGNGGGDTGDGSDNDPPDTSDPEPPSTREGCDYLDDVMHARIRQIAEGPWEGWCMESDDRPVGGGPGGSRGFHHRESLMLEAEMGERGRVEFEVMVPDAWKFGGGAHFFQITNGGCPNDRLPNCLRLDWQQPKDEGFRVGIYNQGTDETSVPVVPLYADRRVLWPDSFTHVVFQYAYNPATGDLEIEIQYTNDDHGVRETVWGSARAARNVDGVGRFAKWGRMHPTGDAGRGATCWIRNDRYDRR